MVTSERNCLFQPVVPNGHQVRKKRQKKKNCTSWVSEGEMVLFMLFSFLTDFLRKCEQMSFRLESPTSLCKNDCVRVQTLDTLAEDSGQI